MLEACWPKSARTKRWTVPVGAATAASEAAQILATVGKLPNRLDVECTTAYVKEHLADGILPAPRSQRMRFDRPGLEWPVRVLTHNVVPVLVCK